MISVLAAAGDKIVYVGTSSGSIMFPDTIEDSTSADGFVVICPAIEDGT